MASKLVSMQQSLRILANAPDVEAKQLQLEGLKNRLEAKASPSLVQAFTNESLGKSIQFLKT
jgi:conserved oligomeric Golgi complex subunit 7